MLMSLIIYANNTLIQQRSIQELFFCPELGVETISFVAPQQELNLYKEVFTKAIAFNLSVPSIELSLNGTPLDFNTLYSMCNESLANYIMTEFAHEQDVRRANLFKQFGQPTQEELIQIVSDTLPLECRKYDIEIGQTLIPQYKRNQWGTLGADFKRITESTPYERIKYQYEVTFCDRFIAFQTLKYFKQINDPMFQPMQSVVTDGIHYIPVSHDTMYDVGRYVPTGIKTCYSKQNRASVTPRGAMEVIRKVGQPDYSEYNL